MTFFEKLERFGLYSYDGMEGSQTVFQVKKRYYIDRKIVQKLLFYEFKNILNKKLLFPSSKSHLKLISTWFL